MKKIINPFAIMAGKEAYNCFGCSPANNIGLHLDFWLDGEELVAEWQPQKSYEGWTGILHGGIQATLMDEAAAWLILTTRNTASVTSSMNINYLKPVFISTGKLTVRARLHSVENRIVNISCFLRNDEGEVCSEAKVACFCFPEHIARAKYNYPGMEAFFEK
jgi:uncharacterized protein (TIGR00369 family)